MSLFARGCCGFVPILNQNYYCFTARHTKTKLFKCTTYFVPCLWKSTTQSKNGKEPKSQHVSFEEMVESRRQEACRSILVQVQSDLSCSDLHKYCSQYGEVNGLQHYSLPGSLHFVVVEFKHQSDVNHVLNVSSHINKKEVIPVRSPFLWFRAPKKTPSSKHSPKQQATTVQTNEINVPSAAELKTLMQGTTSLSDQIAILHQSTSLSDLGSRLRFLTARQVELALSGLFPHVTVLPFGSSVNGFGKAACDLDLVLLTDREDGADEDNSESRLVFHAKTSLANGRTLMQRHMEMLGDVCQLLLPGCSQVRRILQARVPIIKYHQDFTGVECDLSMTNMSAIYMSEFLYILGALDSRVKPLVFAVRSWAREVGLTNPSPGRWITNFSLTLLVVFYLQHAAVLPSLNTMISLAGPGDHRVTLEGANCTFVRDISRLCQHVAASTKKSQKADSLEFLFLGFFEFYSSFDFSSLAVSIPTGTSFPKPDHSPLYITNPMERGLNVSKNVSHEETERLRIEFRNAAWMLESVPLKASETKAGESWGLNALFELPQIAAKGRNIFYIPTKRPVSQRIVEVTDLFAEQSKMTKNDQVPVNSSKEQNQVRERLKPTRATSRLRRR